MLLSSIHRPLNHNINRCSHTLAISAMVWLVPGLKTPIEIATARTDHFQVLLGQECEYNDQIIWLVRDLRYSGAWGSNRFCKIGSRFFRQCCIADSGQIRQNTTTQ